MSNFLHEQFIKKLVQKAVNNTLFIFFSRACREHWEKLEPATGRPLSAAMSKPDEWQYTLEGKGLMQQKHETTKEELADLFERKREQALKFRNGLCY